MWHFFICCLSIDGDNIVFFFLLRRLEYRFLWRGSDFGSRMLNEGSVNRKTLLYRRLHLFGDPFFCVPSWILCTLFICIILGVPFFPTEFAASGRPSDLCSGGNRSYLEKVNDQPNYVTSCFISVPPKTWYIKDFFHSQILCFVDQISR